MDEKTVELGDDLLCIACGYDLRELPPEGNCPECGLAIERSVGSEKLARADPVWLRKIVIGQSMIAWGMISVFGVIPALGLLMLFTMVLTNGSMTFGGQPQWIRIVMMIALIGCAGVIPILGILVFLIGSFFVTAVSPQILLANHKITARSMVRVSILGSLCFGSIYTGLMSAPPGAAVTLLQTLTGIIWSGGVALVFISLTRHIEKLLSQIPEQNLLKCIKRVRRFFTWAMPLEIILLWLSKFGSMILTPASFLAFIFARVAGSVIVILGIVILVEIIQMMIFMFQVRRPFRLCHSNAQSVSEQFTDQAD